MSHNNLQTVALLSTGDEIINGDILNTNSQEIALQLFNHGIRLGNHMVARDNIRDIEEAMHFLLNHHQALIITGGLGPTSDDLTRYALANVSKRELVHDETTWNNIVQRLKSIGYDTPPDSNKQQALFPAGATIISNPNGTASGCMLQNDDKWIFMLPGPPMECLPMFESKVLSTLVQNHFQHIQFHRKWLLFGVSEGEIAEKLDALVRPYNVTTGYRIWYPYIEFKIYSSHEKDFKALEPNIEEAIAKYIIEDGRYSASERLKQLIPDLPFKLSIDDKATGGQLETVLLTPKTYKNLLFSQIPETCHVQINGLNEFWNDEPSKTTHLEIIIQDKHYKREIPLRGLRVKQYAVELICRKIYQWLTQ